MFQFLGISQYSSSYLRVCHFLINDEKSAMTHPALGGALILHPMKRFLAGDTAAAE